MSRITMAVFIQSLVSKIKFPEMEITRNATAFRNQYKKVRGIPKNASALVVLRDVKTVCEENEMEDLIQNGLKNYPQILAQL